MTKTTRRRQTIFSRARSLAERTPASRNRYVDLLRAVSIIMVVIGHWLVAGPYVVDGELSGINMLANTPWTQWLTWVFQVMPVFFMVGGYSNRVSWGAALRDGQGYGAWLATRMRRLLIPTIPLVLTWAVLGLGLGPLGFDQSILRLGSQGALIPVWFLAAYVVVVALTPVTSMLWDRYGWGSVVLLATAATIVDLVVLAGFPLAGWANFVFVWAAVAQVGMAWQSGRLGGLGRSLPVAALSGLALTLLVSVGPYPLAMVGVPGADGSNNSPPTIALLAFGVTQVSLLLAAEDPVRRWLDRIEVWSVVVLMNGMIMSIYLWHLTAMVLLVGGSLALGGLGLGLIPGGGAWWLTRPLWLTILAVLTLPLVLTFARFDRVRPQVGDVSIARSLMALAAASFGLAMLARSGIIGPILGVRLDAVAALVFAVWLVRNRTGRPVERNVTSTRLADIS